MDLTRALINVVLAFGQIAATVYLFSNGFQPAQPPIPQSGPTPIEPAGYAFAIWAPIYVGSVMYALWAVSPAGLRDPVLQNIGWSTAAVFLACIVWLFAAAWGPVILTVPMIIVMFWGLAYALLTVTADPAPMSWPRYLCVLVPLSLYCGWVTVAMFANASEVLPGYGFDRFGLDAVTWTLLALTVAASLAVVVTVWIGSPTYVAAIVWALIAIAVAAYMRGPSWPIVGLALVAALVVLVALALRGKFQNLA